MLFRSIKDNLYLSGSIDNYDDLTYNCIGVVVNIRNEQQDDIYELTKRGIAYYYIPVGDYWPPRMELIRVFLNIIEKNKDKGILVHCAEGKGRSAMLIACYLVKNGMSSDDAVIYMKKIRPEISLTEEQMKKLRRFENEK